MHDIRWIRDNPAEFDRCLMRRKSDFKGTAQRLIQLDETRRAAITAVPGTCLAWTMPGMEKSPAENRRAMSRMCARIIAVPAESAESRCSTIRPPSGSDSKTCDDVYWSTPIAVAPRSWSAANAESGDAAGASMRARPQAMPMHRRSGTARTRLTRPAGGM